MNGNHSRRWRIAWAGVGVQCGLGSIYAWSYFQNILTHPPWNWTPTQAAAVFSVAIGCIGVSAAVGGLLLRVQGPRRIATVGTTLFSAGHLLAAWALARGSGLGVVLGYGLVGGVGLGLGYATPVTSVASWFPDRKGLATGLVIMGFGFGALVMSKVLAPLLWTWSGERLERVLGGLGLFFALTLIPLSRTLHLPPALKPAESGLLRAFRRAPRSWFDRGYCLMWLVFFFNIVAGIAVIPFQSPFLQALLPAEGRTGPERAALGATLIAIGSLCNGIGRLLWGWLSDGIGRVQSFRLLLAIQLACVVILTKVRDPWFFGVLVCLVLLCYGGGFGVMPAFVLHRYGAEAMPVAYGAMLTAWSAAGVAGPMVAAWLGGGDGGDSFARVFGGIALLLATGFALALYVQDRGVSGVAGVRSGRMQ